MDKEGVEEDNISFFHLKVYPIILDFLMLLDAEIGLINVAIPVGILVVVEPALMRLGDDVEAAIKIIAVLECCPSSHDVVCWPKREIRQVLVEGVSRTASHSWRFINEHSVD